MSSEAATYKLRAELRGHDEDVRALCACDLGLITASRDKTIKLWREVDGKYEVETTFVGHQGYVTAVAYIAPGLLPGLDHGAIVSGSRDNAVKLWSPSTGECLQTLSGHKHQVTDLAIGPDGEIASASLDSTLRLWKDGKCTAVLEGHTGAVQCVLYLPSGEIVSGANDNSIRVWSGGKCLHVLSGHTDTVRGLALLPGLGVVSASHDQTLRVWTLNGDCVSILQGHSAIIYSCAATDGLIASASEDNTARLWRPDGTPLQSIEHPGCVWDVGFLPNGDLVTGCADYAARIWTASPDRAAPAESIQVYEAGISARKAAATEAASGSGREGTGLPDGLKLEDESSLLVPGNKAGEMKVVREGGGGVVYTWDADKGAWDKVGSVVGGPEDPDTMGVPSKWHNGRQYDHVVDVDFEDGVPHKKLAFNRTDNPYDVAERFLLEEGLPITYRQQVVDYILNLMGQGSALPAVQTANVDPFTSSGAYVPGASNFPTPGGSFGDPFTSSGGYVPSAQPTAPGTSTSGPSGITGGGADPFTGGNSRRPALTHIPAGVFYIFDSVPKLDAIGGKVREFSSGLSASPDTASLSLTEAEVAPGGGLDTLLAKAVEAARNPNSEAGMPSSEEDQVLEKLLRWPPACLFPALDIARLLALNGAVAQNLASSAGALGPSSSGGLGTALAAASTEPQLPSNLLTGLRLACNMFRHSSLRSWIQANYGAILDAFASVGLSANKNVRSAWASFLVNLSLLLTTEAQADSDGVLIAMSAVAELLNSSPKDDSETMFRGMVAAGTLMQRNGDAKGLAKDLGVPEIASQLGGSGDAKITSVAAEVVSLL
ncbi:g2475 [Coccomyxa elongata]